MITCHSNQLPSLINSYFAYLLNRDDNISKISTSFCSLFWEWSECWRVLPWGARGGFWLSHCLVSLPSTTGFTPDPLLLVNSLLFTLHYQGIPYYLITNYKSLYDLAPGQMASLSFGPFILWILTDLILSLCLFVCLFLFWFLHILTFFLWNSFDKCIYLTPCLPSR